MIEREMKDMESELVTLEDKEKNLVEILSQDLCYASISAGSQWSGKLPDLIFALQAQWKGERSKWEAERTEWEAERQRTNDAQQAEREAWASRETDLLQRTQPAAASAGKVFEQADGSMRRSSFERRKNTTLRRDSRVESFCSTASAESGNATHAEVQDRTDVVGGRVVLNLDMGDGDGVVEVLGRGRTEIVVDDDSHVQALRPTSMISGVCCLR